ncbi:A24 family peptidase [Limnohabitans sp. DM1]|uniref:prepilin peptidase n=1 Tax=Limnohabitans sp. DM1 TaxID=1597955 RepID=UPI000A82A2D6|nr:A24 family peptidase [Limnohabitans sp. DM1]
MSPDSLVMLLAAVLGLAIGSFLNVVIHRLPRMLEAQWQALDDKDTPKPAARYNIATPSSHCPQCGHALNWHENIPVLSYLLLRGRCSQCRAPIGWRYPAVELLTAALFVWSYSKHGFSLQAVIWAGFASALVALAAIDADTTLLPDALTQPLTWSGLLAASLGLSGVNLHEALWGATAGYLFLWSVYWLFRLFTGKDGMGQGDFKLLAALGAWFGWPALVSLVLIASVGGAIVGLGLRASQRLAGDGYIPFGPFLSLAGLWVMVFGPLPILHVGMT